MENNTLPSICIPRTLSNVTWRDVKKTFEVIMGEECIDRVDVIKDRNNEQFCKIFIHMTYWPKKGEAINMRERLLSGETVKIVYEAPWFWKCSASRLPRPNLSNNTKKMPYIEYEKDHVNDLRNESPMPIRRKRNTQKHEEEETSEA